MDIMVEENNKKKKEFERAYQEDDNSGVLETSGSTDDSLDEGSTKIEIGGTAFGNQPAIQRRIDS